MELALIRTFGMGKKNKKQKELNLIDLVDKYVFRRSNLWWLILFLFIVRMIQLGITRKELRLNGINTYGIVSDETPGVRGGKMRIYRYYVPERGEIYTGITGYSCSIGDTIQILYDPKRPERSDSKDYITSNKWTRRKHKSTRY